MRRGKDLTVIGRCSLLKYAGLAPLMSTVPRLARAAGELAAEKPDYPLRIRTGQVELAPEHIVSTTLADKPGLTHFHCHQQLHMDFGFMALFKYG
jgi:FtsP/CotA-like multicopper oxidase with cupredoxin domain